mmetsp:Transcript_7525/g.13543  ORF Transcript_7525/g.13543 Transcript_7525/m.13543 type:complete len:242 (+) Transcript_7525:1385-2110(+)
MAWNRSDPRISLPTFHRCQSLPHPTGVVLVPRPCPPPIHHLPHFPRRVFRPPVLPRVTHRHKWQARPPNIPQFPCLHDDPPLPLPPPHPRPRGRHQTIRSTCASPPLLRWPTTPSIPYSVEFQNGSIPRSQRQSWEDHHPLHERSIPQTAPIAASIATVFFGLVRRRARCNFPWVHRCWHVWSVTIPLCPPALLWAWCLPRDPTLTFVESMDWPTGHARSPLSCQSFPFRSTLIHPMSNAG